MKDLILNWIQLNNLVIPLVLVREGSDEIERLIFSAGTRWWIGRLRDIIRKKVTQRKLISFWKLRNSVLRHTPTFGWCGSDLLKSTTADCGIWGPSLFTGYSVCMKLNNKLPWAGLLLLTPASSAICVFLSSLSTSAHPSGYPQSRSRCMMGNWVFLWIPRAVLSSRMRSTWVP